MWFYQVYERVCDLGSGLLNICDLKRHDFVGIFGLNCADVSMSSVRISCNWVNANYQTFDNSLHDLILLIVTIKYGFFYDKPIQISSIC